MPEAAVKAIKTNKKNQIKSIKTINRSGINAMTFGSNAKVFFVIIVEHPERIKKITIDIQLCSGINIIY